jgi:D-arabinose 1-dehydrogenase-like Zn-dependent alcohol dehydrogenase
VAAPFEPIEVGAIDLLMRDARIQGWSSGTATDSTDAMVFAARHDVRPMIETFPLADASSALEAMQKGTVRFRAVIQTATD